MLVAIASIICGYAVTSLVLLKMPLVLHQKKKQKFRAAHISHRGGAGENLENTMTAFRHAKTCGTQMLEIDCQLTADGQVVVAHDNHLLRVADVDAFISDLPYARLPPIKTTLPLDFNKSYLTLASNGDRKIPLLKELFNEFPDTPINIDIKVNNDMLIEKVSELVKEHQREHLTVWGNFSDVICQKCYKHNPNIPLLFSLRSSVKMILLYYTGLLPFVPLKESFLEVMMPSIFLENPHVLHHPSKSQRLILTLMEKLMMRKAFFDHLHRRGIQIYLWVLNSDEEFQKAFELGADGVMTDFPTRLREFLIKHPQFDVAE